MKENISVTIPEAFRLARSHYEAGRLQKAERICRKLLEARPGHPRSLHLLGLLRYKKGKFEEAANYLELAVQGRPRLSHFQNDLGASLSALGRHEEALDVYLKAQELAGNADTAHVSGIYRNIAIALQRVGRIDDALEWHARALQIDPGDVDAIWNRCHIYLAKGEFSKGWEGYEKRLYLKEYKKVFKRHRNAQARWDGTPFPGKTLLIQDEQGLGDAIQFIRLAPLVKQRGGKVIVETRQRIRDLLSTAPGFDEIISRVEAKQRDHEFDLYIPLMSLPGILGIGMDMTPVAVPYLKADSRRADYWKRRLQADGLKVGLVWSGNLENLALRHRSIELQQLAPYLNVPGTTLYSLQYGETGEQLARIPGEMKIHNLGNEVAAFDELAAAVANLDLVISVDTAMVHLAGAMGCPVWMLLSYPPDWRWMLDRDDCPWYPGMRIFRQQRSNDWQPVFRQLEAALTGAASTGA